jgi:molybdenum cofactor biosynthesis enzyme MoaA
MMRFPLRLRAELQRARLTQVVRGKSKQPLILQVSALDVADAPSGDPEKTIVKTRSEVELLEVVRASAAPVVWMGGAEPLLHPEIGLIARRITDTERYVFLETEGIGLRRGIFAFRPVPKLFLAVQLHGLEKSHDARAGRPGVFGLAMEGIRAARLSGFHVCAHTVVDGKTDLEELRELRERLVGMDVDGQIISAAPLAREDAAPERVVCAARKIIGHRGWSAFSLILGELPESLAIRASRLAEGIRRESMETVSVEEGVGAP